MDTLAKPIAPPIDTTTLPIDTTTPPIDTTTPPSIETHRRRQDVKRQVKRVVGELEQVLKELQVVVDDLHLLAGQIDVVVGQLDVMTSSHDVTSLCDVTTSNDVMQSHDVTSSHDVMSLATQSTTSGYEGHSSDISDMSCDVPSSRPTTVAIITRSDNQWNYRETEQNRDKSTKYHHPHRQCGNVHPRSDDRKRRSYVISQAVCDIKCPQLTPNREEVNASSPYRDPACKCYDTTSKYRDTTSKYHDATSIDHDDFNCYGTNRDCQDNSYRSRIEVRTYNGCYERELEAKLELTPETDGNNNYRRDCFDELEHSFDELEHCFDELEHCSESWTSEASLTRWSNMSFNGQSSVKSFFKGNVSAFNRSNLRYELKKHVKSRTQFSDYHWRSIVDP